MARLDWTTFLATHTKAHLLAGHVPEPSPTVLKRLRRLLQALIGSQAPAGDYATAIVRRRDITEIQCGFAELGDAERVGARLGSAMVTASGDWLSERSLRLDERAELALEDMVAHPRKASRHDLLHREPLPSPTFLRPPKRASRRRERSRFGFAQAGLARSDS